MTETDKNLSLPLLRPLEISRLLNSVGFAHPSKLGNSDSRKVPRPGESPGPPWFPLMAFPVPSFPASGLTHPDVPHTEQILEEAEDGSEVLTLCGLLP
jgi:hypothetical protein